MGKYGKCLHCDGTDFERARSYDFDLNTENQSIAVRVDCENCGKSYYEIYKFSEQVALENNE